MQTDALKSLAMDTARVGVQTMLNASRAYISALYPNEFEYYLFTLELVSRTGTLKQSLIFPVMPQAISETRVSLVNIKKTNSSIISLTNTTFAPSTITINGTFGKKIRILFSQNTKDNTDSPFSFSLGAVQGTKLNGDVKTGYGTTKLLEKLLKRSQSDFDSLLFLYNPALGNSYLVECTDMQFAQSVENNMFWNYSITFKTLAKAEDVYPGGSKNVKTSLKNQMKYAVINRAVFSMVRAMSGMKAVINQAMIKPGAIEKVIDKVKK